MPKAMVRIYLADGQFKSLVLDQNVTCEDALAIIVEKLETTSTANWDDHVLFQSLDYGKEILELNSVDCPYTIAQWWGENSDSNRFVFKRPGDPLKKGIPGFEKYKTSRVERRSAHPAKFQRKSTMPTTGGDSDTPQMGQPPSNYGVIPAAGSKPPVHPPSNPSPSNYGNSPAAPSSYDRPPPSNYGNLPSANPPVSAANKAAMMGGFNPLAPNTSAPKPMLSRPVNRENEAETASRPPMERVPMPGFGGPVGGGMDPNVLQERIKNMKAQQNVHIESVKAWINLNLQTKGMHVDDISKDLRDGTALGALVELLTKRPFVYNQSPKSDMQMRDNLEASFKAFENAGVKATGAGPSDFLAGNQKAILGYLLLLVKKFKDARSSRRFSAVLTSSGAVTTGGKSSITVPSSSTLANQKPSSPMIKRANPAPKAAGAPVKNTSPNVGRAMPIPQGSPNTGRSMPAPPAKKSSAPPVKANVVAPTPPKKGSLPPVPAVAAPAPAIKADDDFENEMDKLTFNETYDEWGSSNNDNNNTNSWDDGNTNTNDTWNNNDYGNDSSANNWDSGNNNTENWGDNSYGNDNSYSNADNTNDWNNTDTNSFDDYGNNNDYSSNNNNKTEFVNTFEDDPDLFDTFNELEDMLSEMANELGVFDA